MHELLRDFLAETTESLDAAGAALLGLRHHPSDPAVLGSLFRLVHSIRGSCDFLGLPQVSALAGVAELHMKTLRDGEPTAETVEAIMQAVDRIKDMISDVEELQAREMIDATAGSIDRQKMATVSLPVRRLGDLRASISRMVAVLARLLDKKISFAMTGTAVEREIEVVTTLVDPIIQIIRNAADHGIESPEERVSLGKTATGRISLVAHCHDGFLTVEIADDGRGLDGTLIGREAAVIFEPGVSTADPASPVSGNGVGLDIVRHVVERIGGAVSVRSSHGRDTVFTLRVPLAAE